MARLGRFPPRTYRSLGIALCVFALAAAALAASELLGALSREAWIETTGAIVAVAQTETREDVVVSYRCGALLLSAVGCWALRQSRAREATMRAA